MFVGGAPISQAWYDKIGADAYHPGIGQAPGALGHPHNDTEAPGAVSRWWNWQTTHAYRAERCQFAG